MGKGKKRVSYQVTSHVARNFDTIIIELLATIILALKSPYQLKNEGGGRGRPPYDPRYVAFCGILRIVMNRSYQKGEAYLKAVHHLFMPFFNEVRIPSSTTLQYRFSMIPSSYLRLVNKHLVKRFRQYGFTLAVDSSGLRKSSASSWFCLRIKRRIRKKDHMKIHIGIDVDTGLIVAFKITEGKANDSPPLRSLLRQVGRIGKLLADKAYSARWIFEEVKLKGGIPYIPFKKNATGRSKGCSIWKNMYLVFTNEPERFNEEYHLRSLVEATFTTLKRCWGEDLTSRKGWLCRKEAIVKVIAFNLQRVAYLDRAEELGIPLWQTLELPQLAVC